MNEHQQVNVYKLAIEVALLYPTKQRQFVEQLVTLMPRANLMHRTFAKISRPNAGEFLTYFSQLFHRNDWVAANIMVLAQDFGISVAGSMDPDRDDDASQ